MTRILKTDSHREQTNDAVFSFLREHEETLLLMLLGLKMQFLLSLKYTGLHFLNICCISFAT